MRNPSPDSPGAQLLLPCEPVEARASDYSPLLEIGAYELLWQEPAMTFRRLAALFRRHPRALPSHFVAREAAEAAGRQVLDTFRRARVRRIGVRLRGAGEHPARLEDARDPLELLYFQGRWDLVETPCLSLVGTRRPSRDGLRRAASLARQLAAEGWTVVSGLAAGVDTAVHQAALAAGGPTIAVLGTPLTAAYPPENAPLQASIAARHLVLSQCPVLRSARRGRTARRGFFPERNATMAALSRATVIVEASDISGTLYQARAALEQGRHLFILESCFRTPGLRWPHCYEQRGAVRVQALDDIRQALGEPVNDSSSRPRPTLPSLRKAPRPGCGAASERDRAEGQHRRCT